MNCEEAERFLDAYLDGELDLSQQLELEQHLNSCKKCQAVLGERREFRTFFTTSAPQYKAPSELRNKVLALIRQKPAAPKSRVRWSALWRRPWMYAAALLAIGLPILWFVFYRNNEQRYAAQAVSDHLRALFVEHVCDVDSADPQVIKSYLATKLDFSPPVADLASAGYEMRGGRVDVVQNRRVAALIYRRNKEIITLFTWPAKTLRFTGTNQVLSGLTTCTWNTANLNFIAVSTLNDDQLDEFTQLFREKIQ
jgi:mycothiol system anti-sigma-R factor